MAFGAVHLWKKFNWVVKVKVAQSSDFCNPMNCTVHGILQARILEWEPFPSPGDLPNLGIEPRSPSLQVDSLPAEPQGKPKNTGVGSLSLLQCISPTQELNRDLLHCKWILYQLSYKVVIFFLYRKVTASVLLDWKLWKLTCMSLKV